MTAPTTPTPPDSLGSEIVRVEARHVQLPTGISEFTLPSGQRAATDLGVVLVRLTDGDGVHGTSFLWASEKRQGPLFEAVLRYFAEQLIQAGPTSAAVTVTGLRRATNFIGYDGLAAFAVAAYDMALHDLICRRLGVGLGTLLGRHRDRIPAYRTALFLHSSVEELITEAKEIEAAGLRAVKMQVGKADVAEDLERIEAVRASFAGDVTVMVDAMQKWTFPEACRAAQKLAAAEVLWLEDALDYADLAGYRRLVASSPIPIATGESLYGAASFRDLVDAGVAYVMADLQRVGGIRDWMRIAGIVSDGSSQMLPHLYPHVSAQLLAALPTGQPWLEYVDWFDQLVTSPFQLEDGQVVIPDIVGSGFNPSDDATEDRARGPWLVLSAR